MTTLGLTYDGDEIRGRKKERDLGTELENKSEGADHLRLIKLVSDSNCKYF